MPEPKLMPFKEIRVRTSHFIVECWKKTSLTKREIQYLRARKQVFDKKIIELKHALSLVETALRKVQDNRYKSLT